MSSTSCKAKAEDRAGGRSPLGPGAWLAEAQDTDQAGGVGRGLWPSPEQQQDSACACVHGGGGHAEEAAAGRWRGFSSHVPSAPALLPERGPQSCTWPLALALRQVGGPAQVPSAPTPLTLSVQHILRAKPHVPRLCPGPRGRGWGTCPARGCRQVAEETLAGSLAQHREPRAHLSDDHAVHLALGRGVLLGQDAPQCGLQVREPVTVLQVGRGADHGMHQGEVLHAQLREEHASSRPPGRPRHQWTGHYCLMAAARTPELRTGSRQGRAGSHPRHPQRSWHGNSL